MTTVLDGKALAAGIRAEVSSATARLRAEGVEPALALVVATADGSAQWYVRSLTRAAANVGIAARVSDLGPDATEGAIGKELTALAGDPTVHGIVLQTPLPGGVDALRLTSLIPLEKDADGANPLSAGYLMAGGQAFAPATAAAVIEMLRVHGVPLAGTRAVVVGRSMVVGKPLAHLLLAADATVTICHSKTTELAAITQQADVLVAAIGRPAFFGRSHLKPGAVAIDVGTTPDENGNLVGDIDAHAVQGIASALTPVPGGVGPVTTALLLKNTVVAATVSTSPPAARSAS